ncbi:MAG: hypothetical protein AB7R89_08995 [Dehalococcoidia bacterium]
MSKRRQRSALDGFTERLLAAAVPADLREPFVGDLVEEADISIAPERGVWRARLWLWGQVLGSLPALLRRRDRTEGAMDMRLWKLIVVPMVLLAVAQAWDSGVFDASPVVMGMVLVAIALPVAAVLLTARLEIYVAALVLGFLLLLTARIVSPEPLPELFLVLVPFAVLGLLTGLQRRKESGQSGRARS